MIGAFTIVFREVIEAGLIIGIVLGITRGVAGRGSYVAAGIVGGLIGAAILAAFAGTISDAFEGRGQEILNASVLLFAVLMLTWHNAWMAKHGAELAREGKALGRSVAEGTRPMTALAVVCGAAVLREGAEVVLILYGIVAGGTSQQELLLGSALGVAAGAAVSAVTYFGLIAIPMRHVFKVTGVMIVLLAAGMAGQAVVYLANAGIITGLGPELWDTSGIVAEGSAFGRVLRTLVGYSDRPVLVQAVAYLATILMMLAVARAVRTPPRPVAAKA